MTGTNQTQVIVIEAYGSSGRSWYWCGMSFGRVSRGSCEEHRWHWTCPGVQYGHGERPVRLFPFAYRILSNFSFFANQIEVKGISYFYLATSLSSFFHWVIGLFLTISKNSVLGLLVLCDTSCNILTSCPRIFYSLMTSVFMVIGSGAKKKSLWFKATLIFAQGSQL